MPSSYQCHDMHLRPAFISEGNWQRCSNYAFSFGAWHQSSVMVVNHDASDCRMWKVKLSSVKLKLKIFSSAVPNSVYVRRPRRHKVNDSWSWTTDGQTSMVSTTHEEVLEREEHTTNVKIVFSHISAMIHRLRVQLGRWPQIRHIIGYVDSNLLYR